MSLFRCSRKSKTLASRQVAGCVALCSAIELANGDTAPEWIELIPSGTFTLADGRGPFTNDNPETVIAESNKQLNPKAGLPIDYDHAIDRAAPKGQPAPAAGWIRELAVRDGKICAHVEWTKDGAADVAEKKWRFISPVFDFAPPPEWDPDKDIETGLVVRITRAALTNDPAITSLAALTASRSEMADKETEGGEEQSISKVVAGLEKLFPNMPKAKILELAAHACGGDDGEEEVPAAADAENPYGDEAPDAMAARQETEMAQCSNDQERTEAKARHEKEKKALETRLSQPRRTTASRAQDGGKSTMTKEELDAAIAKHPLMIAAQKQITELTAAHSQKDAAGRVDTAIKNGKLTPAQREWAIAYCSTDPKGFDKFIGKQPTIVASGSDGTFTSIEGDTSPDKRLSPLELKICAQFGHKPEDYLAQRTKSRQISRRREKDEDEAAA